MISPKRRFRVAFSFAGEKRGFVEKTARVLAAHFGKEKILYDKYHEAEFARFDFGLYLPKLYREQSDLIVPVLSSRYDHKRWAGWEWAHIFGLLTKDDSHRVLPCRFDYSDADGLGSNVGFIELDNKTPEQFANIILERLAFNEGQPMDYYTKTTSGSERVKETIPNNLPRLQAFFGRETELKMIAEALSEDARGWGVLIVGIAGIGKTALAIRAAAESMSTARFRRILFLSAKERELTANGQSTPGGSVLSCYLEMLNAIAYELDRAESVKMPEAERGLALLRALRGAEVLFVLDNLETFQETDRNELFSFLNRLPRGCSAIVTSRVHANVGAVTINLDKPDWPDVRELLVELMKNNTLLAEMDESDWQVLYQGLEGNPLAIRLLAGQLGRGRYKTINDVSRFLRSALPINDPLGFVFGDLFDTFTENETQVLAALGHFSQAMPVAIIAKLAGLSDLAAHGTLIDLSSRALVLPDEDELLFAVSPLVADLLRRTKPDAVAETGDRLQDLVYVLVVENGYQNSNDFDHLEAVWPLVLAALPRFLVDQNSRLQTFCAALQSFLKFTGRWDELLALSQAAEQRAAADSDLMNAGWWAYEVGWVHYRRGEAEDVLACAGRAEAHWRVANASTREQAIAIHLSGVGHRLAKDYPAALIAYREAVALWCTLGRESEDVAIGLNDLAEVEHLSGDFDTAELDYREALTIARQLGFREGIASYTGNLASIALDREDWLGAEMLAREALQLSEQIGRQDLVARQSQRLAQALNRIGKATEALSHAQRAEEIFKRLGVAIDTEVARAIFRESKKLTSCLYVESIELSNIRCFESLMVSFRDANEFSLANIILGDNAAGKSTLLRCLAIGLCNEPDATALLASLPGEFVRNGATEGIIRIVLSYGVGSELLSVTTRLIKVEGTGGTVESVQQFTMPEEDFPWSDIFVCGYGTSRVATGTASYESYSPRAALATLFDERASLWNPELALLRRPVDLRTEMEQRLLRVLMLDATGDRVLSDEGQPVVRGPWGSYSFDVLSDGYRSTSQWVLDLMAWAILANRFGGSEVVRGVLLIDELEQHLHPRWQRHVLQRLRLQLPGMQLIATTHTPLIAAGTVDLDPSTISRLTTPEYGGQTDIAKVDKEALRGKRADQVLTSEAFGLVTSRSPGSVKEVERYQELSNKARDGIEQIEFERLAAQISANSVFGETEYERAVEEAINETLTQRLIHPPAEPLDLELKRQLRELFKGTDSL